MITRKFCLSKLGQVWIETAIYTLIGLSVIAILLSLATPQIDKMKDRGTIQQTITALGNLDSQITDASDTAGTIKVVPFKISKGKLNFDPLSDRIVFVFENTRLKYSEVGSRIPVGDLFVETQTIGKRFNVFIELNYANINLTFSNGENNLTLHPGATPHNIQIENVGDQGPTDKIHIDLRVA